MMYFISSCSSFLKEKTKKTSKKPSTNQSKKKNQTPKPFQHISFWHVFNKSKERHELGDDQGRRRWRENRVQLLLNKPELENSARSRDYVGPSRDQLLYTDHLNTACKLHLSESGCLCFCVYILAWLFIIIQVIPCSIIPIFF